jgi:hypothetical protein
LWELFISDFGYGKFCPQKLKSKAGFSLQEFLQDVGIPRHLHTDVAKEMTLGTWLKTCKEAGIKLPQQSCIAYARTGLRWR